MAAFRWKEPNPFPAAALAGLDGARRDVAATWRGGAGLIVLGHSDCGTSRLALPFVDRAFRERPQGLNVLAVLQDTEKGARDLASRLDLQLPIVLERDPYPLAAELQLRSVPVTWLVGADGVIRRAMEGFSRDEMERLAAEAGIPGPFFRPEDTAPARRPG
jgi:hypothetical protein